MTTLARRNAEKRAILELGLDEEATFAGLLPTFVTNQNALDYLDATNTQVESFSADVTRNLSVVPPEYVAEWAKFVQGWTAFYTKNRTTTHYFDTVAVMDATDGYVVQLKGWQHRAKSYPGWKGVTPDVTGTGDERTTDENARTIRVVAIAGAVALGSLAVYGIVRR